MKETAFKINPPKTNVPGNEISYLNEGQQSELL